MGFNQLGTYLTDLHEEQKRDICTWRILNGSTYSDIAAQIEVEWGHEVSERTVSNFFRSLEGEKLFKDTMDRIREEHGSTPLVDAASRIMVYRGHMRQLQRAMEDQESGSETWIEMSQEFRQYGKMIREEMLDRDLKESGVRSPAELMVEAVKRINSDDAES